MNDAFDITQNRHKGNAQSVAAHKRLMPTKQTKYQLVINTLAEMGEATPEEVSKKLGVYPHTISGRFSEGKVRKAIEETGEIRNGGMVLRIADNSQPCKCGHSRQEHTEYAVCRHTSCACIDYRRAN